MAEIFETIKKLGLEVKLISGSKDCLIIESTEALPVETLQKNLGGSVKIGRIIDVVKKREQDSINFALKHYFKPGKLKSDFFKSKSGKVQFGLSIYPIAGEYDLVSENKRLGMMIKKSLQEAGMSLRLVFPEFNSAALSSVLVTHNHIIEKGADILIFTDKENVYVGKTLIVQDFEDYGRRDYQRPYRDDKAGMIPPKVAQALINLTGQKSGGTILDPFCGSGTIIQEGMLQSIKMVASDVSPAAVNGCVKNLEWFRNRYRIGPGKYHAEVCDARSVSILVEKLQGVKAISTISGIATEGTLGPTYTEFPTQAEIAQNFKEIGSLYKDVFTDLAKFLPQKAKIAMCLPSYKKSANEYILMPDNLLDEILKSGYTIKVLIPKAVSDVFDFLNLTPRGTCIYDRKDQIVAREIIVFEKI